MREEGSTLLRVLLALCLAGLPGCASAPPPPDPVPVAAASQEPPQPDEWNLFPDPTSGTVQVYHYGKYVGAITGNEPPDEDPPRPHPVDE